MYLYVLELMESIYIYIYVSIYVYHVLNLKSIMVQCDDCISHSTQL